MGSNPENLSRIHAKSMGHRFSSNCVCRCCVKIKLKKETKGSLFLSHLAEVDCGFCLLYLWMYSFTSAAIYLKNYTYCKIAVVLLMFCIIFEKFLWTCSSRTRQTWKAFTIGKYKKSS
nr:hypothetical protein F14D7.4 - Caenorhabditis elegans [Caenorhabditis elegans]